MLLIEGPPGIGKTSLLDHAAEVAESRGVATLSARSTELERGHPFGAVRQLLERHVRSLPDDRRAKLLEGAAAASRPALGLGTGGEAEPADPSATLYGLWWVVASLSEKAPLLLRVDDVQWADPDSLRFISFLAPRLDDVPVVVIATARIGEWRPPATFAGSASDPLGDALSPAPLSPAACAELAAESFSGEVAAEFAQACHSATGGNPFFLASLLAELRRVGISPTPDGASRVLGLTPRAVIEGVNARLASLSPGATAAARAVAVVGDDATVDLTAALAGVDQAQLLNLCDELAHAAVLEGGEPLRFVHPILRTAVYEDIERATREALHRRSIELLEARRAPPERIASHFSGVAPAGDAHAVALLRGGATAALGRGAPASAVTHLRRALAEPPADGDRGQTLAELGLAESLLQAETATEHLGQALELIEPSRERTAIANALQRTHLYLGDPKGAITVLRAELERPATQPAAIAAGLDADLVLALSISTGSDLLEADRRLEELAAAGVESIDDPLVLSCLAFRRLQRGTASEEIVAPATRALELADVDDPAAIVTTLLHAVGALLRCDELDAAAIWARRALEGARRRGSVLGLALANWLLGEIARRSGRLADAIAHHEASLREARAFGTPEGVAASLAGLIDALTERGETADAEAALEDCGMASGLPGASVAEPEFVQTRARLRLAQGDLATALPDFHLAETLFVEQRGAPGPGYAPWRSIHALALLRADERARAAELAAEELELAGRFGVPSTVGVTLTAVAAVEGGERAIDRLHEAVEALDGTPRRLEHARALVDLGAALRRQGSRSEARDPLQRGIEIARRCGATPLVARAYEELGATGARPRKVIRTGLDTLTPSEARTARMAASGMTNREIAQDLFVTVKTVESHLGQVYRKLELDSRAELAAALRRDS